MILKIDARHDLTDEDENWPGIPRVLNLDTSQSFGPDEVVFSIAGEILRQALPKIFAERTLSSDERTLLDSFLKSTAP